VRIEVTSKGFEKAMAQLDPKAMERAMIEATNRSADKARTAGIKATRETYNIPARRLRDKSKVIPARSGQLKASIIAQDRKATSLAHFGARQVGRGVTVAVKRGERKLIPGGFLVTMRSGFTGVFWRAKRGGGRVARYPIRALYGPSVAVLFGTKRTAEVIQETTRKSWPATFFSRYSHHLKRSR